MADSIRLAILGAGGRMGRALVSLALDDDRFALAAAHSRAGSEYVGRDAALLAGRPPCGLHLIDSLSEAVEVADVVVDFTRPEFTLEAAAACADAGRALVSGTTGMAAGELARLGEYARTIPLFHAPNMSIGVNLLIAAAEHMARQLDAQADVEIIEAHHRHKVDAPSGTALALGEAVARARGKALETLAEYGREGRSGPRVTGRIGFHSIRGGEIVGEHDLRFISAGEEIRLGHTAFSREAFASGALRAAAWLAGREAGFYGMADLLGR